MNCRDVQFKISEWLDGETPDQVSRLKGHMELCQDCASFYQDMQVIKETSCQLGTVDPPDRLWISIRRQLTSEGLVRIPEKKLGLWERIFPMGVWPGLKPALSGAIVALILSVSVFYLINSRQQKLELGSPEAEVFQQLQQAELNYLKAIESLSEVSQRKIENMDPAMAQILNDNLATMDYYVKECQEAVRHSPDNPLVHKYLLTAYQKKIEIMQSIVNSDVL
jgi:hypothetical protein